MLKNRNTPRDLAHGIPVSVYAIAMIYYVILLKEKPRAHASGSKIMRSMC